MDCSEPANNCRFALLRVSHIARTLESHSPICTRDYRAHRAGSGPPRPNRYAKKSAGLHDFRLTPLSLVHGVRLSAHGEPVRQQPVTVLRHD